eukprot:5843103-Amphidinium_carterae.1
MKRGKAVEATAYTCKLRLALCHHNFESLHPTNVAMPTKEVPLVEPSIAESGVVPQIDQGDVPSAHNDILLEGATLMPLLLFWGEKGTQQENVKGTSAMSCVGTLTCDTCMHPSSSSSGVTIPSCPAEKVLNAKAVRLHASAGPAPVPMVFRKLPLALLDGRLVLT